MKISDYPYSSKSVREKFFKEMKKLSQPASNKKSKEMTLKDFALALSGGSNGR